MQVMSSIAAALVAGLCLGSTAIAAPSVLRAHFTVQLNVEASGTSKESVVSHLTSELKKLNDVDITSDGTSIWVLYLNIAPIADQTGIKGYALSTVIADQYAGKTLQAMPAEDFKNPQSQQAVKDLSKDQVNLREHLMQTCTVDKLNDAYAAIIEHFNEVYLVPVREDIDNYNFTKTGSIRRPFDSQ